MDSVSQFVLGASVAALALGHRARPWRAVLWGGAVATLITSFDVWHANLPRIEIYGSEGTLLVPDPNGFGGPVMVRREA